MKNFAFPAVLKFIGKLALISPKTIRVLRMVALFMPAALIMISGALLVYSPRLALAVLALLLVMAGAALACLVVYVLKVKRKVESVLRQFQGRVVLQGVNLRSEVPLELEEPGKIVFH